jgi:hypothetical protein
MNYKAKIVTVEEMLKQATFLKKLKFPFIFIVLTLFVLYVVEAVENSLGTPQTSLIVLAVYNCLVWLLATGGFLIYGRRLVSLLPNNYSKKVKRLTFNLIILSVSCTQV